MKLLYLYIFLHFKTQTEKQYKYLKKNSLKLCNVRRSSWLNLLFCSAGRSCGVGQTQQLHGLLHVFCWTGLPHRASFGRWVDHVMENLQDFHICQTFPHAHTITNSYICSTCACDCCWCYLSKMICVIEGEVKFVHMFVCVLMCVHIYINLNRV